MSDLPAWVYDMVMDLQRWSDEHPKLFGDYVNGMQPVDNCGCGALDRVPAEARTTARAMASYLAAKNVDKAEVPDDPA